MKTRGLKYIKFDIFMKELSLLNSRAVRSTTSILSDTQKDVIKQAVWALTCGRSWLTGEIVPYDKAIPHHILHDPMTGKTLYGAAYESSFQNFAIVFSNKENRYIERSNKRDECQALFIYMWQKFKEGDFKAATDHWGDQWNNRQFQLDFLRERKSKKYLNYWLSLI